MDSFRYTAAAYGISITNINPGPVKTDFLNRVETTAKELSLNDKNNYKKVIDNTGYLHYMTNRMVELLNQRTNTKGNNKYY